jgi:hypothetical protein
MAYYLDLFSPETYEAFTNSSQTVSGFRYRQRNAASKLKPGDKMLCYITKISRWVGILEIESVSFTDDTPIFYPEEDPFVVRFKVKPLVWLDKEKAIPIKEDFVWDSLSFTKGHDKKSSTWTGKLRASLNQISKSDGDFLQKLLLSQISSGKTYPLDEQEYEKLLTHQIRRHDKTVTVSVPKEDDDELGSLPEDARVRESIRLQALLAEIGSKMGMSIWIPKNDRTAVLQEWGADGSNVLSVLPLNYDETTLKTIEQIDILWLRRRSIIRAFEVEHTTSVYSGILRMADLLALQPNMDIKLHIVAPEEKREKVFREIRRPVFSLLEKGPLSESCTYLSYESIKNIAALRHLNYLSDSVLDEYAEEAE